MDSYNKQALPVHVGVDSFSERNNIRVHTVRKGFAQGELLIVPQVLNPLGIVHGGALATLADTVGGYAVHADYGKICVTLHYHFHFLRASKGSNQKIVCTATPVKLGRTTAIYHMSLTDDLGKEVAAGDFTFFCGELGQLTTEEHL